MSFAKETLKDKIINAVFLVAIAAFGFFVWHSIQVKNKEAAIVPPGAVELEFPLPEGNFYVMYLGPDENIYGRVHATPTEKYALDIVKDAGSRNIVSAPSDPPQNDPVFGAPVSSPCAGQVVWVQNNMPDLPVGNRDQAAVPNSVTIECDGGFTVMMAHFKQGSVVVNVDNRVKAGDPIAQVGNSGNTTGPHLHIAAFRGGPDNPVKTPLPMTFGGRYLQKGDNVSK